MSEIPEMVERVARKIYEARFNWPSWDLALDHERQAAYAQARAAIKAMREPTDAMIHAMHNAPEPATTVETPYGLAYTARDSWISSWQAGVDAALTPPTSSAATPPEKD